MATQFVKQQERIDAYRRRVERKWFYRNRDWRDPQTGKPIPYRREHRTAKAHNNGQRRRYAAELAAIN